MDERKFDEAQEGECIICLSAGIVLINGSPVGVKHPETSEYTIAHKLLYKCPDCNNSFNVYALADGYWFNLEEMTV